MRSRVEVERVIAELGPVRAALEQVLLDGRNRRLCRPSWEVPSQDEHAPRPQYARDLGEGTLAVEPMEGLGGEDRVDRGIRQRDLFGASGKRLGFGAERHEQAAHRLGRLDGNHTAERRYE